MGKRYHVVVVGAGISGLATAIAYARNADIVSRPVLLLEKEPKVGGLVTSFKREGFLFDTVQILSDVTELLAYFEVDLPLKRFEGYYARIFIADPATGTSQRIDIPSGVDAFKEMLNARFPQSGAAAARMLDYSVAMFDEMRHLRLNASGLSLLGSLFRCRRIIRNQHLTFDRYLRKFGIDDPALREVFDVFAAFGSLPTERVSAMAIVGAMISTLRGAYRPVGGFIKLPHQLRRRAEALGVEVWCGQRVEKIRVANGAVDGIRLADGTCIDAEHVVAAVDTKVALREMVGDRTLRRADPAYADKVEAVRMSPSGMTISLGLAPGLDLAGLGMDCGYNVITTGKGTFETLFRAFDAGKTAYSERCFHTAAICPSLTTGGKPTLVIRVFPMPMADWADLRRDQPDVYARRKRETADFFIRQVERYLIPGLSRYIEVVDIASPATFGRYAGSPTGSNFDMSPYPENYGRKRLKTVTPIRGLLLPKFSHSIFGGLWAGIHTADHLLGGAITGGRCALPKP